MIIYINIDRYMIKGVTSICNCLEKFTENQKKYTLSEPFQDPKIVAPQTRRGSLLDPSFAKKRWYLSCFST